MFHAASGTTQFYSYEPALHFGDQRYAHVIRASTNRVCFMLGNATDFGPISFKTAGPIMLLVPRLSRLVCLARDR